jgi:tRNA threonylcarbamoyladenosine biosynthesis protein TsaB
VRVGISTVQGLALGTGRPCVALSSLLGLAAKMEGEAETLIGVMDAYRDGQVYAAAYDASLRPLREPAASPIEDVLEGLPAGRVALLGDGALRYRDRILARASSVVLPRRSFFLAAALGRVACERLQAGAGEDASRLRPLYLRAPDIRASSPRPAVSS